MSGKATDWDAYYKRPAAVASVTRRISAARILRTLAQPLAAERVSICELGGANSCFIDDFLRLPSVGRYDVLDLNDYGIELLTNRFPNDARVGARVADALATPAGSGSYDIVYSVGLIEHFDPQRTARCIDAHFNLCRAGGTVLITFPTPTPPYRLIRGAAELLGIWAFPDERPLSFAEVGRACSRRGTVVHQSINWAIGLTQGYVMTENASNEASGALPFARQKR